MVGFMLIRVAPLFARMSRIVAGLESYFHGFLALRRGLSFYCWFGRFGAVVYYRATVVLPILMLYVLYCCVMVVL